MKQIFAACLSSFLALALVGCGKSSDEKAKEKAEDLLNEQHSLVAQLRNEVPNSSWTDAQLDLQLKKLSRLETVESALISLDSKEDSVIITGKQNTSFIAGRRELIALIKASRAVSDAEKMPKEPARSELHKKSLMGLKIIESSENIERAKAKAKSLIDSIDVERRNAQDIEAAQKSKELMLSVVQDCSKLEVYVDTNKSVLSSDEYSKVKHALDIERKSAQEFLASIEDLLSAMTNPDASSSADRNVI